MRVGRLAALAVALVLAPLLAVAQVQPDSPPDAASYAVREELAEKGNLTGSLRVLRFVQVSDAHILDDDAPYPLRQEPLDRFGAPFTAAQRPQEEYTDEVLDSIVQAINAIHSQDALQFVMNTGDNIDNDLENELMRFIDLFDGTTTLAGPVSGFLCLPDGQSTSVTDTAHDVADACTSLGEALAASHAGLATGLPWYSAFGNHDALIQGNANIEPSFQEIAASMGRRLLPQTEYVAMHFPDADSCTAVAAGTPADDFGHGYGFAGDRLCDADPDNDGYYSFAVGGVHFIVLDTVNDDFVNGNGNLAGQFNPETMTGSDVIGGYAEGAIDPDQAAWLVQEIDANPDKLIVIFSHHTVNSMFSSLAEGYCNGSQCLDDLLHESGYKTGPQLVEELSAHPNVVGWIGGHTHRHRIQPKTAGDGGFWNIESASLIDWPQEARVVELWITADGAKGFWLLRDFGHTFQLSKDLEATDPQREPSGEGAAIDQEAILWFDIPAGVTTTPQPVQDRQLSIRLANATPEASVGRPAEVRVHIADSANGAGVDGLNVSVEIFHSTPACNGASFADAVRDFANPPELTGQGNGTYNTSFNPVDGTTHYLTVTVAEEAPYAGKAQLLSLDVTGGEVTTCPKGKGAPALAFPLAALVVFAAVAVLRRR